MTLPTFDEFRTRKLAEGFDEVIERDWAPGTVVPTHTHPFDASALVTGGEMWLKVGDGEDRRLGAGDRFELVRDTPHTERYGAEGARFWVARRH